MAHWTRIRRFWLAPLLVFIAPGAWSGDTSVLTDDDVAQTLAGGETGVFYAWSPHMPLSVDGLGEILAAGKRMGISVMPVLSSHANVEYARDRAGHLDLPDGFFRRCLSAELEQRDFNVHAPAILVFDAGRFISPVIPGFRYAADYEALISRFLASARQ